MPTVKRSVAVGTTEKTVSRHYFGGSLIAKKFEYQEQMEQMAKFYSHGLEVEPLRIVQKDKSIHFYLIYRNANAGHYLPTGDPERFLLFTLRIIDQNNQVFFQDELKYWLT